MKFISLAILLITLITPIAANAGIIEADIYNDGSNKGFSLDVNGYDLEWMDFGITNGVSFDYILNHLETEYSGWRIATRDDVDFLYQELTKDFTNVNKSTSLSWGTSIWVNNDSANLGSPWESIFSVIGLNGIQENYNGVELIARWETSFGLYGDGTDYFQVNNLLEIEEGWSSASHIVNGYNDSNAENYPYSDLASVMLVRTIQVPEPSTIAIFSMALFGGLARKRLYHNN